MKVLVIEDDPDVVSLVSECIKGRWPQAEVLGEAEGKKGLEIVEAELPDLRILDIGLPDIDGWQVLRRLRMFSNLPVVILSGLNRKEDFESFLRARGEEYLLKPFDSRTLISSIEAVLGSVSPDHRRSTPVSDLGTGGPSDSPPATSSAG